MKELATKWLAAFDVGDPGLLAPLFSDGMQVHATNLPAPLSAPQLLGFFSILYGAFDDLDYHWKVVGSDRGSLDLTYQLTGTHTGLLALSGMGMQNFEPTGGTFSLPEDEYHLTVDDGLITRIDVDPPEGAGLGGILAQLGLV